MTTIETQRLLLPLLTLADCAFLARAQVPRTEWAVGYPTDEDVGLARWLLAGSAETSDWGLRRVLLHDDTVIGGIGLFGAPGADGSVTVGYGLASSARGNGYATEAELGVTSWAARNGAQRARADPLATNIRSQRVLERAGFVRTGEHDTDEGLAIDYEKQLQ